MNYLLLFLSLMLSGNIQAFQEDISVKIHKADSLLSQNEFHLSLKYWEDIVQQSSEEMPQYSLYNSKMLFSKGRIEEMEGNHSIAAQFYKDSQKTLSSYNETDEISFEIDLYNALYHSLAYAGNWDAALEVGNEGLCLFNDTIDKEVRANYIYDLGYINDRLKKYHDAIHLYQQSITLYKDMENKHFDLGLSYNNLGTSYQQIGFFSERLKSFETARFHWEKDTAIDPKYLNTLYGNLMKLYIEYGDNQKAKELFNSITNLKHKKVSAPTLINRYRLKVIYLTFAGEGKLAQSELEAMGKYFNKLSPQEQQQLSQYYLTALIDVGNYNSEENNHPQASSFLNQALELSKKYKQHYYRMLTHTKLAKNASNKKQNSLALEHLEKALAMRDLIDIKMVNEVNIMIKKATLQAEQGLTTEAYQTIQEALSILGGTKLTDPQDITMKTFEKQHSSFFIMALKDAAGFYKKMFDVTNRNEDAVDAKYLYELSARVFALYYQNGEYNTQLNNLNKTINQGLYGVHTALEIPLSAELLSLIEGNNSQVLRNEFERKHLQFLNLAENTLANRNFLHLRLQNLKEENSETAKTLKIELRDSIAKLDVQIAKKEPLYHVFYNEEVRLQKIQDQLSTEELLVKYFIGTDETYAITISKSNIKLYRLAETALLREKLDAYYPLLQNPQNNTATLSQKLYKQLVLPFEQELKKYKTLTIIPDDFLHYLPFEVLGNNGTLLIQSHELQYANSLALWLLIKNTPPDLTDTKNLFAAFAPHYNNTQTNSHSSRGNRFKDIAGAKKEAREIAAIINGDVFLNERASLQNFMEHTTSYKIYHLAMHALLDEDEHTRSSLIFQDGSLDFSSLYGMYFPADLVVLSACNTGVGKLAAGEGLLSLSRALTYSGVRSSVYSLWEVPDDETSEIMISFYNYLNEGENKATALAAAKRDFIKNNPLKTHPYFWAGFVINGDDTPIVPPKHRFIWYMAGGLLLMSGVFYFRRGKKTVKSI